jgi:hypothetical protein
VKRFYVITPVKDQRVLARRITAHWKTGFGAGYNPDRQQAMALIQVRDCLEQVLAEVPPETATVATSAKDHPFRMRFAELQQRLIGGHPHLLLLGTAWGLHSRLMGRADAVLEPICGVDGYNHLSVRSAAAIILDRLVPAAPEKTPGTT